MAVFTVSITYDYNSQTYTDLIFDSMDHTPAHNVISPVVKLELNKAGTLEFTAHPLLTSHDDTRQLFNHITPLNTFVTAKYDDDVIFHGRVLYCNTDFYRQKKVYCEGDLAFLVDSICNKFDYSGAGIKKSQLLQNLIGTPPPNGSGHDGQVETKKQITIGTISAGDKDEVIKIKSDNYIETWSAIEQYVLKGSRGFIRTRYENGTIYLDWLAGWDRENETTGFGRTNTQRIEFGRNLLELDDGINANEIFTRLVPIGKDGLTIAVNPNDPIYMDITGGVQKYGYITRVKEFNDITDKAKLVEKATEYTYYALSGIEHTYSVKAVDLHLQDDAIMNYRLGDVVELYSPLQDIYKTKVIDGQTVSVGVKRVCTAVEYHLADIENTAYSFGIPENADPSESSASSHSSGSGKSTGSKTSSSASSQITTEKKETEKTEQRYEWVATRTDENGKILQQAGIELTASGIIHYATDYEYNIRRQFKRVFIQTTNPSTNNEIVEGDVWIVTEGIQTWQQMGSVGRSWVDSSQLNWEDYAGCKQYIWKNGDWQPLNDSSKELYNTTKIDQNAKRIALLADDIDAFHSELEVTAQQIKSEITDTNNSLYSQITQTATLIRSEVADATNGLRSIITQTATMIRAEVADSVNGLNSIIEQTADHILAQVSDNANGIAALSIEAGSITARVEDVEGNVATLVETASGLQASINDANSNINTLTISATSVNARLMNIDGDIIELNATAAGLSLIVDYHTNFIAELQVTASNLQASVSDANNSISTLTLEAGSIRAFAGTKSRVWIQEADPMLEGEDVHIGDYWIKSSGYHSWGALNDDSKTWDGLHNEDSFNWEDYSGCPVYVLEGGYWTLVSDTRKLIHNKTRLDITDERIALLAKDVDDYRSEFEVRASQIRSEVRSANNSLYSRITQTAEQIRSEVGDNVNGLRSSITQTATQIRAEVADSINGLSSSIDIQSSKIELVVESNGSGGYRPAVASIVAAVNANGDSSVTISASKIQLDAAHSLKFLTDSMTLSSPSGGGVGVRYDAGSEITGLETLQANKVWGLNSIEVGDSTANDKELLVHGLANVSGKVNISNASSSYTYALEVNGSAKFNSGLSVTGGNISGTLNGTVAVGNTVNAATLNVSDSGTYRQATWQNVGVVTSANLGSKQYYTYTNSSSGTTITGRTYGYLPTGTTTIYYLGRTS